MRGDPSLKPASSGLTHGGAATVGSGALLKLGCTPLHHRGQIRMTEFLLYDAYNVAYRFDNSVPGASATWGATAANSADVAMYPLSKCAQPMEWTALHGDDAMRAVGDGRMAAWGCPSDTQPHSQP